MFGSDGIRPLIRVGGRLELKGMANRFQPFLFVVYAAISLCTVTVTDKLW